MGFVQLRTKACATLPEAHEGSPFYAGERGARCCGKVAAIAGGPPLQLRGCDSSAEVHRASLERAHEIGHAQPDQLVDQDDVGERLFS